MPSPRRATCPTAKPPSLPLPPPQKDVGPRTRRTERDRSRRGWSHPEHRGSAARGWTRPRLAMPSRRRMCGWWRRRVRHFAAERRISLGPGPERRQNIAAKIRPAPDKLPTATHRRCDGGKSSIELRRGAPGAIDGVCGRRWAEGSWPGRMCGGGLTTATLLEAERAPTTRVLWRRAFRNIL